MGVLDSDILEDMARARPGLDAGEGSGRDSHVFDLTIPPITPGPGRRVAGCESGGQILLIAAVAEQIVGG